MQGHNHLIFSVEVQHDYNLLLYLTSKHVFLVLGGWGNCPVDPTLVAGLPHLKPYFPNMLKRRNFTNLFINELLF